MKIYPIIVAALILSVPQLKAQAPFNTIDSVDINKFNAAVLVHGDMWWDPAASKAQCKFPNGTQRILNFVGALWISGYDGGNNLHVSAQTYRQDGNDYWPGPLDASGSLSYATSHDWAKIWKVNRTDINYFRGLTTLTTTTIPPVILTWPAKGNAYAQGNAGALLSITDDMAPFIDLNGNGIYEPLLGEYPDVPGDQALWWVFSDNGPTHTQTNGNPLKVEVHAMAYAYNRGTLIDNVVYYAYKTVNKSGNNYHDVRISLWDDIEIGYQYDDMIGFDSTWRLAIGYNGTTADGGTPGHPGSSYNGFPPVIGITQVVLPGDAAPAYVPAGSFVFYNNDLSIIGNPTIDTEYSNYLRAKFRNGQHLRNDFWNGTGAGTDCNYVFPGDPGTRPEWSECAAGINPGNQRLVLSSNDFNLNSGSSEKIVLALIATDTGIAGGGGGCPNVNFTKIKEIADTAWHIYHYPPKPLVSNAVTNLAREIHTSIYPNPAHDQITLETSGTIWSIKITNAAGQAFAMLTTTVGNKTIVDISKLQSGLYYLQYHNTNGYTTTKFIKE